MGDRNDHQIDIIKHLLSIQHDELQNEKIYNRDGDLSEYSDSDDEDKQISATSKEKYLNDLRSLRSLHSIGLSFWHIMKAIKASNLEPQINSYSKQQLINLTHCNMSEKDYCNKDYKIASKNERMSIKALHKNRIRIGQLSCYFPPLEKLVFSPDKDDVDAYDKALHDFAVENTDFIAWFCKRTKRNKPVYKLEPYLYENKDINCWSIGQDDDYPEWKGLYRLNVAKSFYNDTLYYSIKVNKNYNENDTYHPFHDIITKYKCKLDDDDETEFRGWVLDNVLNRTLFSYLAMDNKKLGNVAGNIFCAEYRQGIICLLEKSRQ